MHKQLIQICLGCCLLCCQSLIWADQIVPPSRFITHIVDPSEGSLVFFWRDKTNQPYQHFYHLEQALTAENKTLRFAMNGGIFQENLTPLGLYVEKGEVLHRLSLRQQGYGNFYIQPNGVFYLTESRKAFVIPTGDFKLTPDIDYATQSGPMLVVNGEINSKLTRGSTSLRVRNGVGILPDGRVMFVLSKRFVNFYDFANYFKQQGCQDALYLDGSVSRIYLPEQNIQSDGRFGVIIGQVSRLSEK
jgi:uncharacterized protein YigE (DUF2233 family)